MIFVRRTFPGHMSENVACDSEIQVLFFKDIDASSITEDKVILFSLREEKSVPIRYRYSNQSLYIKPLRSLDSNAHYQVQIIGGANGILDIVGGAMAESYSFEFYTSSESRIDAPIITYPVNQENVSKDFHIKWTSVQDAYGYEVQVSKRNNFDVLKWPLKEGLVYETNVDPHIHMDKGAYYVRVRAVSESGLKSDYSEVVQFFYSGNQKMSYETIKGEEYQDVILKTSSRFVESEGILGVIQESLNVEGMSRGKKARGLELIGSLPKHGDVGINVQLESTVVLEFNQEIDQESLTEDSIYVVKERF